MAEGGDIPGVADMSFWGQTLYHALCWVGFSEPVSPWTHGTLKAAVVTSLLTLEATTVPGHPATWTGAYPHSSIPPGRDLRGCHWASLASS